MLHEILVVLTVASYTFSCFSLGRVRHFSRPELDSISSLATGCGVVDAEGPVGVPFDVILDMISCNSWVSLLALFGGGGGASAGCVGRCHCVMPLEL